MVFYYPRQILKHGYADAPVYLMNEAPGPNEARYKIPSVAAQGGNIYRALRRSKIGWATQFNQGIQFKWPTKPLRQYKKRYEKKPDWNLAIQFLNLRKKYLICSNSYPYWPKPSRNAKSGVTDPDRKDVLSKANIRRISSEITPEQKILLICGEFAWLACFGTSLNKPMQHVGRELSPLELKAVNMRLGSSFQYGWYMGQTRTWTLDKTGGIDRALRNVGQAARWP